MSCLYLLRLSANRDAFGSQDLRTSIGELAFEPCSQFAIARNGCGTTDSGESMANFNMS